VAALKDVKADRGSSFDKSPVFPLSNGSPAMVKGGKAIHPFFVTKSNTSVKSSKPEPQSKSTHVVLPNDLPLWPTAESIHCGGSFRQSTQVYVGPRKAIDISVSRKATRPLEMMSTGNRFPSWLVQTAPRRAVPIATVPVPRLTSAEILESIPEAHQLHPAISRLIVRPGTTYPSHRIWNDKYAPRRAEEILHNTNKALYLRDWLKALEIQMDSAEPAQEARGIKRPRPKVQRDVGKRRGRKRQRLLGDPFGGLNDFIVDDDEWDSSEDEEEDGYLSLGDDLPRTSTVSSPISSREVSPPPPPLILPRGTRSRPFGQRIVDSPPPRSPPPLLRERVEPERSDLKDVEDELVSLTERLANTILLTGPCGSGKTAAVYACAEELKWKVFEFYPGIGKRSGAGFMAEVGGTGDNHRVGGTEKEQGGLKLSQTLGYFTSPSKKGPASEGPCPESNQDNNDVRQSLILIEEADIVYQSDGNLWPTLINFIRKSRRPIILTCNGKHDTSLSQARFSRKLPR